RRAADAAGLLPAAHLRGSAGRGVLVREPPAADQERLQDGLADRPRLRGVLPAGLPRPGLRRRPALRGRAGGRRLLSVPAATRRGRPLGPAVTARPGGVSTMSR